MQLIKRIICSIAGPIPEITPADAARKAIESSGYPESIRAQTIARFNRRMWAGKGVDESLRAVTAWADAQVRQ